ncbi:hypothetical protein GCM10022419_036210 [Nonomuraea rosea]|uniref:Transposase n=1 Tax=Nonomuraea rosea TaxID=638574 RepID=A0ABP6WLX4_9ACTN
MTELLKLSPDAGQREALLETMRACNAAADRAAEVAFAHRALGAVPYDPRILTFKGHDQVSIATLGGRILVPVLNQGRWSALDGTTRRGQTDLIYRDGQFYLASVIEVPEPPAGAPPRDWLGVDLGIVNLATDSHGTAYSGRAVRAVRFRNRTLRARLQRKGTKSAKRLLKKRRRAEARFARNTNHVISKRLVGKAKDTRTGIALEDLGGIRERVTVTKAQRADLHAWSFRQLRTFVTYKAALAGVHVRLVDPRNTSRTCPSCGHCAKRNRPHRDSFLCVACGFAGPADHIAAINIGRRAVSHAADDAA